jgi:hypothetical protein
VTNSHARLRRTSAHAGHGHSMGEEGKGGNNCWYGIPGVALGHVVTGPFATVASSCSTLQLSLLWLQREEGLGEWDCDAHGWEQEGLPTE